MTQEEFYSLYDKISDALYEFYVLDGYHCWYYCCNETYNGTSMSFEDQRDWSKFVRFWDISKIKRFDINTLQPFDKVLVRNTLTTLWKADFYSFSKYPEQDTAKCVGGYWFNCIPYNDDTKHLIGTNDDCPEHYKWWKTKYDEF